MDIRQLEYFIAVCREGSFGKAADALFLSQQGLSASVARLERELSAQLLVRTAQGVSTTPEGAYFLERAQKIVALYAETADYLALHRQRQSASLSVCASFGVLLRLSKYLPYGFAAAAPDIAFSFSECPDLQCEEKVLSGECELGFSSGGVDRARFSSELLFTTPISAVINQKNPLAACAAVGFSQMRNETFYLMDKRYHTNQKFFDRCKRAGFAPKIAYETMEMSLVFQAVQNNDGVGILNRYSAEQLKPHSVSVVAIDDPTFVWDVSVIWRKGAQLSAAGKRFIAYLQASLQQERAPHGA